MKLKLLMTVMIWGIGCGIKGPPLPPLETVSDRANNGTLNDQPAPAVSATSTTGPASSDATKKVKRK